MLNQKLQREGENGGGTSEPPETPPQGPDRPVPMREAPTLPPIPPEGPDREIIKGM
ncbi:hypothetical protein ES703_76541 [subsurface metagenome]